MSESKRAEIEEKRQKLELLKKKKLAMLQHQQQTKKTTADLAGNLTSILGITPQQQDSSKATPSPTPRQPAAATPSTGSSGAGAPPPQSEAPAQTATIKVSTVQKRSFTIDLNLAIVDIPPKEITTYTRSTQTFIGNDEDDDAEMSRESEEKLISTIIQQATDTGSAAPTKTAATETDGGREIGESIDISADLAALNKKEAEEQGKKENPNDNSEKSMLMNRDEANSIMNSFSFMQFFNKTSRCLERAVSINEKYPDISKDYLADSTGYGMSSSMTSSAAASAARYKQALVLNEMLVDEKVARTRSITCLDWSPKNPELLLAGFSASNSSSASSSSIYGDSDGIVMVWSVPSALRKSEYTFTCQSDVMSSIFVPSQPQCIAGGTKSGQVVLWDMRCGHEPVVCIQPSTKSHNTPIYSITYQHNSLEKDAGGNYLTTLSSDGKLCKWSLRNMSEPISSSMIQDPKISRNSEITAMTSQMTSSSLTSFVIGRDDGVVTPYDQSSIAFVESATSGYGNGNSNYHTGPVLSLDYHPVAQGSYSHLSNLLLSASADWSVKLWSVNGILNSQNSIKNDNNSDSVLNDGSDERGDMNSGEGANAGDENGEESEKGAGNSNNLPLYTFGCNDYVFDAKWSPVHPGTFAVADGCGTVSLWDITERLDAPIISCQCGGSGGSGLGRDEIDGVAPSATALKWNHAGSKIAVGDSFGRIHVFGVGEHWQMATAESWAQTNERVKLMSQNI